MIHLAWPWMLLAIPLPWLLARLFSPAQPQGGILFLPFAAKVAVDSVSAAPRRTLLNTVLLVTCWLLLVAAATRPQWLDDPLPVSTQGRRMLLAIDVSGSMSTEDMANGTSRLAVVKHVAGDFIGRRKGDQVGLILFGTHPYLQAPITTDLHTVQEFLQESVIGVAGTETAIGDAIGMALKQAEGTSAGVRKKGDTVLVLLTDGGNDAGVMAPIDAAKIAARAGMRIYTIGVGAAAEPGEPGGNTDLDENTLKSIAKITGGEYFRATDEKAMQDVYAKLDTLEQSSGRQQWYRPSAEWYAWPLALALVLSVAAVLIRRRM